MSEGKHRGLFKPESHRGGQVVPPLNKELFERIYKSGENKIVLIIAERSAEDSSALPS